MHRYYKLTYKGGLTTSCLLHTINYHLTELCINLSGERITKEVSRFNTWSFDSDFTSPKVAQKLLDSITFLYHVIFCLLSLPLLVFDQNIHCKAFSLNFDVLGCTYRISKERSKITSLRLKRRLKIRDTSKYPTYRPILLSWAHQVSD